MAEDEYTQPNLFKLKKMWLNRAFANDEERVEAEHNFDDFVKEMIGHKELHSGEEQESDEPPRSQMFMELILETESAMEIIPTRVATYRQLLTKAGLDKAPVDESAPKDEDAAYGGSGTRTDFAMPGINLADQASLAYHQILIQLCMQLAQSTLEERHSKPTDDPRHG
jgi:hypothetical protein